MIINFIKIMYTLKKPFNALLFSLLLTTLSACGGELTVEETTVTLAWDAPTMALDGITPLTGSNTISGYTVYYGTSSGNYASSADAGNATKYTVTGLSGGTTYYFAVTASNTSGESGYSNEVSKTF